MDQCDDPYAAALELWTLRLRIIAQEALHVVQKQTRMSCSSHVLTFVPESCVPMTITRRLDAVLAGLAVDYSVGGRTMPRTLSSILGMILSVDMRVVIE